MNDLSAGSTKESEVFSVISRIDSKLENLRTMLSPITKNYPKEEKPQQEVSTILRQRLFRIEDNITDLLDTIEL